MTNHADLQREGDRLVRSLWRARRNGTISPWLQYPRPGLVAMYPHWGPGGLGEPELVPAEAISGPFVVDPEGEGEQPSPSSCPG